MLILIGGNGFIGRHVTIMAAAQGTPVAIVGHSSDEAFSKKYAPGTVYFSVEDFHDNVHDLLCRAEALVYLAGKSIPGTNLKKPWLELEQNVTPAFKVFEKVSSINPSLRIVYISSGGTVYGRDLPDIAVSEDHPLAPISPYGFGKKLAEEALEYQGRIRGQNYAILRVGNPVGRWNTKIKQGLVNAVVRALEKDDEVTIFGDGKTTRDYLDADDLAKLILLVSFSKEIRSDVWNIGSGKGFSTLEVVETVSQVMKKKARLRFLERRGFDVPAIVLNVEKVYKDFGWQATTTLEQSITKLVKAREDLTELEIRNDTLA